MMSDMCGINRYFTRRTVIDVPFAVIIYRPFRALGFGFASFTGPQYIMPFQG